MSLTESRDALRLMENEVLKSKQGLSGKEDQFYSLLVEERLIDEQLETAHKRIESLKDKRRLTQQNNETTQEAITYRIDQTDQYQSNFSVKQSTTEIQEQELKQQQELFELLAKQIQDLELREAELTQKFEQDDSEQMLLNKQIQHVDGNLSILTN